MAKPPPSHPGAILREIVLPGLKEQGVSAAEVSRRLNIAPRTLYDILEEKSAISPAMALKLSRLLGNAPEHWLNLQGAFDLARARAGLKAELAAIKPLKAA